MNAPVILNNKPRILVTRRWPDAVEAELADRFDAVFNPDDRPMTPEAFREALAHYDAILPTVTDRLDAGAFDVPQAQTRLLANYGVGVSHIDIEHARAHDIVVTNTPDVLSDCTADIAMTLLLMAARRAAEGERDLRAGRWPGWSPTHMMGTKVSGKTLGIVGFGRIGQAMAQRAHHGFGMRILVQNRSSVPQEVLDRFGARQVADLDALLPDCDFVSLHCPGGRENRHLIDSRRLERMKPGAFLINTARGEVVDEYALAQALMFDCIGGAGLDVYEGEPTVAPALLDCDNVVLLPHLGSATRETREAMGRRVLDNLVEFFEGREPADRVA